MQIPLTLEWLKYIFGQQHDSITCHLSSHKVEALWKSTVHNVLNSRLPRNRVFVGWAANCELAFYHTAPSKVNLQEMLVSLFSFVPQTEPEVFTGQWGEHRDLFLAPNNYNHAVATFFFFIFPEAENILYVWRITEKKSVRTAKSDTETNNWNYIFTI